jgi:hypothetical protein
LSAAPPLALTAASPPGDAPASALRLQAARPVASTAAIATLSKFSFHLFMIVLSSVLFCLGRMTMPA